MTLRATDFIRHHPNESCARLRPLVLGAAMLLALGFAPLSSYAAPAYAQGAVAARGQPDLPRMQPVARFGGAKASSDARRVADWALARGDNEGRALVVVDKKNARIFVLDRSGRLLGDAPVLLGLQVGDDTVPGVGDKPLSQVRPEERTTPAGRFVAEVGMDDRNEDVVWVDYDAAVSMHRVYTGTPSEHRLRRLATPTIADNRISWGCINLPKKFYEDVLSPAVRREGAVIYVLPEVHSLEQVFGLPPQEDSASGLVPISTKSSR